MGHAVVRLEGDIVARLDVFVLGQAGAVALDNLFGEGLGDGQGFGGTREEVGGDGRLELGGEGIVDLGRRFAEGSAGRVEPGAMV